MNGKVDGASHTVMLIRSLPVVPFSEDINLIIRKVQQVEDTPVRGPG